MKAVSPNPISSSGHWTTSPETRDRLERRETNKVISWDANGTVTNVDIYYRTTAAGSDNTIVLNNGGHVNGGNSYVDDRCCG